MSIKKDEQIYLLLQEYEENQGLTTELLLRMTDIDINEEREYAKKVLKEFDKQKEDKNE